MYDSLFSSNTSKIKTEFAEVNQNLVDLTENQYHKQGITKMSFIIASP